MKKESLDKDRKRILIDTSTIIPGRGGSGGGIWIYAKNLLEEFDRFSELNNVEIICLKNTENNELSLNNLKVIDCNVNINNAVTRFIWLQFKLPFLCKRLKIDVLHRMTPEMPIIKWCLYVCTIHDLMFKFYRGNNRFNSFLPIKERIKFILFGILTRWAANRSDMILTPSHSIRRELISEYSIELEKINVTHLASYNSDVERIPKDLVGGSIFNLIVVAGFYPHKGYQNILLVVKKILSRGVSDIKITLRGNPAYPQYKSFIQSKIDELGISTKVEIVEFKQEHSLAEIYYDQDCFILLSEYEGFGLPLLEAQQFSLPVICSDIPVFREVLDTSAIFVPPENIDEIAEKIMDLKSSLSLRRDLIQKGWLNVARFSWHKTYQQTLKSYVVLNEIIDT